MADKTMHASTRQAAIRPAPSTRPSSSSQAQAARPSIPLTAPRQTCACGGGCPRCKGGGQPLDVPTRQLMETRFAHDFSAVRVHTDGAAAHAARQHLAKAYTVGDDIVFSANRFAPSTQDGLRLIAHELAHVVQQRRGGEAGGAAHEDDADGAARDVLKGSPVRVTAGSARGVPQLAPEDDLNAMLRLGARVEPPTADELAMAVSRLNAGKSTPSDHVVLLRQAVAETRAFIQAPLGRPLDYTAVKNCCGAGRDVSAASLGGLLSSGPTDVSVARFQSQEVFGANKHGFTVVTFRDGRKFLVDPTFAQFFHPASTRDPQAKTANLLRADTVGLRFANDLVRNGFVQLDETSARLYARALGVERGRESGAAARLLANRKAELVEHVGRGKGTVFRLLGSEPDILDRRDIRGFVEERMAQLRQEGDPYKLLPQLERLESRVQAPQVSAAKPQAVTASGVIGGSKTPAPNGMLPARSSTAVAGAAAPGASPATKSYTESVGPKLKPINTATPGFKPEAGAGIGGSIQMIQTWQVSELQRYEVEKFLRRYAQLQPKIDRFFDQGYAVEVALVVEKPDRPDLLCRGRIFCDSGQINYFRELFITRVESTAPPRFPTDTKHSVMYPTGGRDSFIPYAHQGGSLIEAHEVPSLKPQHADHHCEIVKETSFPPPKISFAPVQRRLAQPAVRIKRDASKDKALASAATPVYLTSANIQQAVTAEAIAKRLTGNKLFSEVKQVIGGGYYKKHSQLSYFNPLDKPKGDALAEAARAEGLKSIIPELSGDGDHDPGSVQIMLGEDAQR
jgi:hypothetical protein